MWLGLTECYQISCDLWMWCTGQGIWVTAVHTTGKQNVIVDKASREKHCDAGWKLNPLLLQQLTTYWGTPSVDLFVSRLNYQVKPFMSFSPDLRLWSLMPSLLTGANMIFTLFLHFLSLTAYSRK